MDRKIYPDFDAQHLYNQWEDRHKLTYLTHFIVDSPDEKIYLPLRIDLEGPDLVKLVIEAPIKVSEVVHKFQQTLNSPSELTKAIEKYGQLEEK